MQFRINQYLKLKLEKGETKIYINNELFRKCKSLLFINPQEDRKYDQINSIDDAAEILGRSSRIKYNPIDLAITPEQEFWGHCSNLQTWAEHNYNTRLLHKNLAFPLLKKLTEVGDPKAKLVFKEEIVSRFEEGNMKTIIYLIANGYLDYLDISEVENIMAAISQLLIKFPYNYRTLVDLGDILYKKEYYEQVFWLYSQIMILKFKLLIHTRNEIIRLSKYFPLIEKFKEQINEKYKKIQLVFRSGSVYQNPEILIPLIIYYYFSAHNLSISTSRLIEVSKITETQFNDFVYQFERFISSKKDSKIAITE